MKTYEVRTHGCQMNVHDSERISGLLESAGYVDSASLSPGDRPQVPDVVVFNGYSPLSVEPLLVGGPAASACLPDAGA